MKTSVTEDHGREGKSSSRPSSWQCRCLYVWHMKDDEDEDVFCSKGLYFMAVLVDRTSL